MKKLVICGCSYSAVSTYEEYKDTSWSEVLAKKLSWELHNFARQGCSNGGIRIQIDEAIKIKADFVIVTPTSYDRIEIPNFSKRKFNLSDLLQFFKKDYKAIRDFILPIGVVDQRKSYDKNLGLDNINYGNNESTMIVETIHSLSENWHHNYRKNLSVPDEIQEALCLYITHLYDPYWKKQCDQWIIRDGLSQLKANNIPFLINPGNVLWSSVKEMRDMLSNILEDKYMLDDDQKNIKQMCSKYLPDGSTVDNPYGSKDPGYHSSILGQEMIANIFLDIIKNRWQL